MTPTAAEKQRHALFTASVAKISKIWPDHANFRLDNPQNETDRRAQDLLETTQEALDACWLACRSGKATEAQFRAALADWELRRFWAAGVLGQGK